MVGTVGNMLVTGWIIKKWKNMCAIDMKYFYFQVNCQRIEEISNHGGWVTPEHHKSFKVVFGLGGSCSWSPWPIASVNTTWYGGIFCSPMHWHHYQPCQNFKNFWEIKQPHCYILWAYLALLVPSANASCPLLGEFTGFAFNTCYSCWT